MRFGIFWVIRPKLSLFAESGVEGDFVTWKETLRAAALLRIWLEQNKSKWKR